MVSQPQSRTLWNLKLYLILQYFFLSHIFSLTLYLSHTHYFSLYLSQTLFLSISLSHTHSLSQSLSHTHSLSLNLSHTQTLYLSHTLSLFLCIFLYLFLSRSLLIKSGMKSNVNYEVNSIRSECFMTAKILQYGLKNKTMHCSGIGLSSHILS